MNAIDLRNIRVQIEDRCIIRDLSLSIPRKTLVGIVGPNGAGKSTLAKSLLRLIGLSGGTASIFEKPLSSYRRAELAKTLSYLPQDAPVHWPIPAQDVVALGRFAHSATLGMLNKLDPPVEAALRATDTFDLRKRSVAHLSGGEYARVMLARALAAEAPILVVDEPIASLDPYHQLHVMEILRQYADDNNTVLAILHDLTLAGRFCDRIVLMKDGSIIGDGRPEEILQRNILETAYQVVTVEGAHEGERFVIPWKRGTIVI